MDRDKLFREFIYQFLTDERKINFERVLENRTDYITVVLEDIYQPHNASAVVRSCDCFGIQSLFTVENKHHHTVSHNVERGASQWIDVSRFRNANNNTANAVNFLKKNDYRIVSTSPHKGKDVRDFDISKGKVALVFGTEKYGISPEFEQNTDEFIQVPMYGFTESLNISVAAAICLQILTTKLHQSNLDWKLSEAKKEALRLDWAKKSVERIETLEEVFNKKFI